jgi:sporulation protein YlmC with PRC-barrel domain
MLITAKTLEGYKLTHSDDEIGSVKEFYFDDYYWTIRYLVADTGNWLMGRQVLLSPYAVSNVIKEQHHITINLTKQQIESSPSLNSDKPVSQQFELDYYGYYGWPMYWGGSYMWGAYPYPYPRMEPDRERWDEMTPADQEWDPHLRSTREVTGYHIQATDGEIGHIEDFIIDDETWAIRYLIVDTRNWGPGKKILLAPQWIDRVSWNEAKVFVNLPLENIKQAPAYTKDSLPSRDYETSLHQHYDRPGYWEPTAKDKILFHPKV